MFRRILERWRSSPKLEYCAPPPPPPPPPPRKPKPEITTVFLRSTHIPAAFWEDEVCYDAWGQPYIRGYGNRKYDFKTDYDTLAVRLLSDGSTSATSMYGTKWKHKSGPPISFGKAPADPFSSDSGSGA